jgi:DNA excision repair protein ERCC-2
MRQEPKNIAHIQEYIKKFDRVKGNIAIFFPSYQLIESFAKESNLKNPMHKLFIEPRDAPTANSSLREYLTLPSRQESGLLLAVCGGKWSEGLDYRGEMLSGAMVIGLPLAPFNRVREMIIRYFKNKFGEE